MIFWRFGNIWQDLNNLTTFELILNIFKLFHDFIYFITFNDFIDLAVFCWVLMILQYVIGFQRFGIIVYDFKYLLGFHMILKILQDLFVLQPIDSIL